MANDVSNGDEMDDESSIDAAYDVDGEDCFLEEAVAEERRRTTKETICFAAGAVTLTVGLIATFGVAEALSQLIFDYPVPALYGGSLVVAAIFALFAPTRNLALAAIIVLLAGAAVFVLVVSSWYAMFVYFTTGMDISGNIPVVVPKFGAAMVIVGVAMLIICSVLHSEESNRDGVMWNVITATILVHFAWLFIMLAFFGASRLAHERTQNEPTTRALSPAEISTLVDCTVSHGSRAVSCSLPEAVK
jgi:hypothetical protein